MPKKGQSKPADQMHSRYKKMRVNGKQVNVHRYIMEQILGRPLEPNEIVHHINGDRYDNRPENLEVISKSAHSSLHNKGRPLSEDHKRKVSQSLIGNQRAKGSVRSLELRKQVSLAVKRARAAKFWSTHRKSDN